MIQDIEDYPKIEKVDYRTCERMMMHIDVCKKLIEDTPWEELSDEQMEMLPCAGWCCQAHWRSHLNHQDFAQSISVFPKRDWDKEALISALRMAMDGSCGTVYRIKGCVTGQGSTLYQVNAVPGRPSVQPAANWPGGRMLNVIGKDLNRGALKALLQ